jgi:hypothetical protein
MNTEEQRDLNQEQELHAPVKPVYYDYIVKHMLEKELATVDCFSFDNIFLCSYYVNTSARYPFLQYLMANQDLEELHFPKLALFTNFESDSLLSYAMVYLSGLLSEPEFEHFFSKVRFDGFYESHKNLYLFFDVTECGLNHVDDIYVMSNVKFALMDEILNHRHVCGIPIAIGVTDFFVQNDSLLFLYDEKNVPYEVPVVGFVGKPTESKLKFTCMFGESAQTKSALLGPYYYFTTLENALTQSSNPDTKGVVRFALLLGQTKHILIDSVDQSQTKQELLAANADHDGLWAQTYDAVYLALMEGENTPMLVVKEYNQQWPLSYHFANKARLGIA